MNTLPENLALRLTKIFTKEEMNICSSAFSQEKRNVSCRVNTIKSTSIEIEEAFEKASIGYTKLAFPENCYILDSEVMESDIWRLKIYKAGKIYLQGISSQIPVHFFKSPDSIESGLNVRILDACAAPGGKTSQLSALYPDAEIFAFEPSKIRFEKMKHNLEKLGINTSLNSSLQGGMKSQVSCIHDSIENISKYISETEYFDMILIDAPCSGEGALNIHNTKFLDSWNIPQIKKNYGRQKRICDSVLPYLKTDGEMIYSTCTIAPEENEAVIHYLLCKYPELSLENIDFFNNKYIKTKEALKSFEKYIFRKEISSQTLRVIPSEYSEGFYVAKLTKSGN